MGTTSFGSRQGARRSAVGVRVARLFLSALLGCVLVAPTQAQPKKVYRVGVIHQGGVYNALVEGLRDGLRELGMQDGRDFVLEGSRSTRRPQGSRGGRATFSSARRSILLYTGATSVTSVAKRATSEVSIE